MALAFGAAAAAAAPKPGDEGHRETGGTNHWAYQPVRAPAPPAVRNARWARTDSDRFILAALERAGLQPAPDADAAVLCRRLSFDLIGLPPSAEELDDFLREARRNRTAAIASLVDRLLASPRFGEHWGRRWLDVARFGESLTLRGFIFREAWRYRDYVINAFNEDRAFDEFIREQIAGDLLPTGAGDSMAVRQRRLIATTFLALGNTNLEEQDKKQLDMDVVDEQLDTLGKAFLAQTIGCARCHDHKFDPIPTRDYYAMAGILRNARMLKHANVSEWLESPLPLEPEREAELRRLEAGIAALEQEIKAAKDAARAAGGDVSSRASIVVVTNLPGVVVDSARARAVGEWKHSTYSQRFIGDGYLHDLNEGKGTKTLSFAPEPIPAGRYEVRLAYVHADNRDTNIPVTVYHADGESTVHVNQREAPAFEGRFVSLGQYRFESNGFANVLVATDGTKGYVTADAVQFLPLDADTRIVRPSPETPRVAADARPLSATPPSARGSSTPAAGATLAALEARLKSLRDSAPRRPMAMTVREAAKIEDCPVNVRGSVHNPGALVPRGFLGVASPDPAASLPPAQSGRRELADWLASGRNPLTARVYVNRVWSWLFGEGLVRSVDNFGVTGDRPTHPELLDDLASRFVAGGWSSKRLVRELVLSAAYQQAARRPGGADPDNRWWAGTNRRRLTAEQLRDAMLVVAGQLDLTPPHGATYPADRTVDFGFTSQDRRRSVYLPVFRNALPEVFEAFDFAPSSMVTGRRNVSTVPSQALFLMNHPFVHEQATAAARRLFGGAQASNKSDRPDGLERDDLGRRIELAYRTTLGRRPTAAESDVASRHLATADEEAGWTELVHALMASADFRYVE